MGPPDPQYLIDYREREKAGPQKCCHTCESYSKNGICERFGMRTPDEFAAQVDACPSWMMELPF